MTYNPTMPPLTTYLRWSHRFFFVNLVNLDSTDQSGTEAADCNEWTRKESNYGADTCML